MARIPDEQVARLKTEVSIVRLVEAAGIELKPHGGSDRVGHCPFHDDKTPSLVISPEKNLWHCLGACGVGGSVIDWVMRFHKVSFRHACELLLNDHPSLAAGTGAHQSGRPTASELRQAASPFSLDDGETALLGQIVDFYHQTLLDSPEALDYLKKRGLDDPELIQRFRLGYANRTLGYRLPPKYVEAGKQMRGALQKLGVLRKTGHEHLTGSLVIPITDQDGQVVQLYGRKIGSNLRKGTPLHLYLPGTHRGVFNQNGLSGQSEIILCESLIDALTFVAAGFENVTTSYGINGLTDEVLAALAESGAERVLIAYDADQAGNQAAEKVADKLTESGLDCFRLCFPKGMDANDYALKVQPPLKSLGLVIRKAEWLGKGDAPALSMNPSRLPEPTPDAEPDVADASLAPESVEPSSLAADPVEPAPQPEPDPLPAAEALAELPASAVPEPPPTDLEAEVTERDVVLTLGDRRWRIRGLSKNTSFDVLKVNVMVSREDRLHVDTFDLYSAKHRQAFARLAASELELDDAVLQRELGKVLLQCEALQEQQIEDAMTPKLPAEVAMSDDEKTAALELLRDPNLVDQIISAFEASGLVGEPVNALVGYLAAVSRKLSQPLAIIIQSTSAAGKSALMDAVLDLVPEEDRIHYSAMTGQSLFYLGETDLKHKILGIAEEEGVRQASYALKLLQSQGELTIASTGKDPQTGKLVTEEYRVEGPVMLLLTTTAIDIDEELLNRCLVLTVDESRDQTRRIQARQRQARTLDGLLAGEQAKTIRTLHRNAQRLLKPLAVVNPYAERLTFLDERIRTRRDHQKYLTLIDTIALLHQHQRSIKVAEQAGQRIEYVEVEPSDIALANRLAHEVLGRSLDELPPQTRRVLGVIGGLVTEWMEQQGLERTEVRLTRRDVRETSGLSNSQVALHLARLVEFEYLAVHQGKNGRRFVYELIFDGELSEDRPRLPGLIEVDQLTTTTDLPAAEDRLPGCFRPASGPLPAPFRHPETASKASTDSTSSESTSQSLQNPRPGIEKTAASNRTEPSAPARSLSSLAAELPALTTGTSRETPSESARRA